MNSNELKQRLDDYIKDNTYNYAFLIDGDWGVGKTYFIKNIYKEHTTRKIVYISLFGRNDINDLRNTINFNIAFNGSTANKKVIDNLSDINFSVQGINFNTRNAKDLITKAKAARKRNYLLVFDDLERCDCEIKDILGLINEFVEQSCSKVAILVDTNRLSENDKNEFIKFQEKVVGVRVKYAPNYIDTISDIINKQNINNKDVLLKLLNTFDQRSKEFNRYNIRTFLFFLSKVDYLLAKIDYKYKSVYPEIIEYCYCSCVYYKDYGKNYTWNENDSFGNVGYDLNINDTKENDDDKLFHISDFYFKGFKFVDDYITNGDLNKDNINNTIAEYIKIQKNSKNDEDLNNLYNWNLCSDKEVNRTIDNIIAKLESQTFNISLYPQIISSVSTLETEGVIKNKYEKMEKIMFKNVSNSHGNDDSLRMRISDYLDPRAKEKANNTIIKINNLLLENSIKDERDIINKLLKKDNWGKELYDYYCDKYVKHILYDFLIYVDMDLLSSKIIEINSTNCGYLRYTIESTYRASNFAEIYYKDLEKLEIIRKKLKIVKINNSNKKDCKVLLFNINILINNLDSMIIEMKTYKENNHL